MKLPRLFVKSSELRQANGMIEALREALASEAEENARTRSRNIKMNEENQQLTEAIKRSNELCKNLLDLVESVQKQPSQTQTLTDAVTRWLNVITESMAQSTQSKESQNLLDINRFSRN